MSRRRKPLSPDEAALWDRVTQGATPLNPRTRAQQAQKPAATQTPFPNTPKPEAFDVPSFQIGEKSPADRPLPGGASEMRRHVAAPPLRMDHKHHLRMTRGKVSPDARIDLHGLTVAAAHPALIGFVMGAFADGKRLLLVITGKGRGGDDGPLPTRSGVLRHQVPHWLELPPLGGIVLHVTQAHAKHGGAGAYYVYLKRAR